MDVAGEVVREVDFVVNDVFDVYASQVSVGKEDFGERFAEVPFPF